MLSLIVQVLPSDLRVRLRLLGHSCKVSFDLLLLLERRRSRCLQSVQVRVRFLVCIPLRQTRICQRLR